MATNRNSLGYLISCDYGLLRDHSAFCIAEEIEEYDLHSEGFGPVKRENERLFIDIVALRRMDLNTSYVDICTIIANFVRNLPELPRAPYILCDSTGVGRGPVDYLRKQGLYPVIGITFTSGIEERRVSDLEWHVPKRNLVSATVLALQDRRLRISPEIEHARLLEEELRNYKLKISANTGNEVFEAGRESVHDDIVSAVLMCAWWAEKPRPRPARFADYPRPQHGIVGLVQR